MNKSQGNLTVYYARPITHYGTPWDDYMLRAIRALPGVKTVINPAEDCHGRAYQKLKAEGHPNPMDYFLGLVADSDAVVYSTFLSDGMIGAGVAKEVTYALKEGKIVRRIALTLTPAQTDHLPDRRVLTVEDTRARIAANVV